MGLWAALDEVYPTTRHQRCWQHKTANVLNRLPKSMHEVASNDLNEIRMAPTRVQACKAFDRFLTRYEAKYPKAAETLSKDREELLAFYDFPAQHWKSLRTTNPIESTFATVRRRTRQTRGCLNRKGMREMMFKLVQCAEGTWRRMDGYKSLGKVIEGVKFKDGEEVCKDVETDNLNRVAA